MKKIISAFLSALMLCVLIAVPYAEETAATVTAAEQEAMEVLKGFGASVEDFCAGEVMTRGEFVSFLMKALDESTPATEQLPFLDVSGGSGHFQAIARAYELGLIAGDSYFRPNDPVLLEHAYKMLVIALGYHSGVIGGSGLADYTKKAAVLSLSKGTQAQLGSALTGANAARLVLNTLQTPALMQTVYGDYEEFETGKNNLLMNEKLHIFEKRGVVTANGSAGLGGASVWKRFVKIDGAAYEAGLSNAGQLLGQRVEFFYRQNDGDEYGTILYAKATNQNTVSYVDAQSIDKDGTTDRSFVYLDENGKTKTLSLNNNVNVIYNGSYIFAYSKDMLMPAVGRVTLIDNDGDDSIETVLVKNYEIAVVHAIDTDSGVIHTKFGGKSIDLSAYDSYTLTKDGAACSLKDLQEWNIVNLAQSGKVAEIVVTTGAVSGRLTEVSRTDGKIDAIVVDGETVEISDGFLAASAELAAGTSGVFYLGADGRVAAAKLTTTQIPNYVIYLAADEKSGVGGEISLQFFNQSGKTEVLDAAERVSVNGKSYKRADLIAALETMRAQYSPVIIDADQEGRLQSIEVAEDMTAAEDYAGYDENKFTLDKSLPSVRFYHSWGGGVQISNNTLIYSIPVEKTQKELYLCEGASKLAGADITLKNVKMYDLDRLNRPAVIVIDNFDADTPAGTPHVDLYTHWYVVSGVKTVVDANGDVRRKVCGYFKSAYQEYYLADGGAVNVSKMMKPDESRMGNPNPNQLTKWGFTNYTDQNLRAGDVLQPGLNAKGELAYFRLLWSSKLDGVDVCFAQDGSYGGSDLVYYKPGDFFEINENSPTQSRQDPGFMSMLYTAYGQVTDVDGTSFRYKTMLSQSDGAGGVVQYNVSRVQRNIGSVYLYNRPKETVAKTTAAQLRVGDKIFLHVSDMENRYLLIIRD